MWIRASLILGLALLFTAKWKDWSVREVQSRRDCRDRSIFLGDETVLSFYMENRKILPLPWIQWEMDWPEGLEERDNAGRERLVVTSSLLPFQRLKRRVRVQAKKRGYYVFKETRISIGDLLGLVKGELVDSQFDALSVYPQVEPLESLLPLAAFPQGNVSVRRWILPDAFQPIGARSYVPGDPIRNMDWKATARRGSLMVREFGYTAEPRLSILLHMGEDFRQLAKPADRERLIAFAASLGVHALDEKIPLAFSTNAFLRAKDPCAEEVPVWHADRGRLILEKAARIADQVEFDFQPFLERQILNLQADTTLLVVAASLTAASLQMIQQAKMEGKSIQLALLEGSNAGDDAMMIPRKEGGMHGC